MFYLEDSLCCVYLANRFPQSFNYIVPCKEIQNPDSLKFLHVESGILGFGIRNTAQGVRNSI